MQNEHIVAIWLGEFASEDELLDYVEVTLDADGNGSSPFENDIGQVVIDEDLFEADYYGEAPDFSMVIEDHSWHRYYESAALVAISRLDPEPEITSILLVFGQKTDQGIENEFVWNYDGKVASGAPITYVGKFEIKLPFEEM